MAQLKELLQPGNILLGLAAQSKKRVFDQASQLFANLYPLEQKDIFESLMARERLGSTYLGEGLSLPHGRLPNLQGVRIIFIRTQEPLAMGSGKDQLSRYFFFLLAGQEEASEHLEVLAQIAELFGDASTREKIDTVSTPEEFCDLVANWCDARTKK